ncbi:DUF998 domain-containing protein [Coralloluteibacterium thermophilus]|uniref:DUF998 domain-containing protein n=1 Tax=Coralloluteibacterium thermophilum TaxID=2707049 RepID=A0ABV9NM38_9GAMM
MSRSTSLERAALRCGLLAPLLFVVALVAAGAASPGYEHALHPVALLGSEVGGLPLLWNLGGFVLPGLGIAVFAWGLGCRLGRDGGGSLGRIGLWMLAISGVAFAACGLLPYPLDDAEGDGARLHVLAYTLAMIAFAPGALFVSASLRRRPHWRPLAVVGPALVALFLVSIAWAPAELLGLFLDRPGHAQRLTLALYFGWVALAAVVAVVMKRG